LTITELVRKSHANAVDKGFYGDDGKQERNVGELLMLIVSELGEALEAHRKDKFSDLLALQSCGFNNETMAFEEFVKDGFEDEIADTFIRLADMCGYLNIDIEAYINAKMAYNATREKLHGKRY